MIRGIAKPYAVRVKDGSNTITTVVSQKIFIQKVIAALVCIALDFTAPSLLSGISSNDSFIGQLSDFVPDFQVKNQLQSFSEEIVDLPQFDKLFEL